MGKINFNGRFYEEPSEESQRAFETMDVHSFRYYPKDGIIILTDACCRKFDCKKTYQADLNDLPQGLVFEEDKVKYARIFSRIKGGEKYVTETIRGIDGNTRFQITMAVEESDEYGDTVMAAGMIQLIRKEIVESMEIVKDIQNDFIDSLRTHRFEVWYQPKYSSDGVKMIGAEALIRWRDENGNLVSPGEFVPHFEKSGLISMLDEYVFREVCLQQKNWLRLFGKTVPVSINVSRASLCTSKVVEKYHKISDEVGVRRELVPLEITESMAETDGLVRDNANELFATGFSIHIDDFGTGYSSLASLNLMKFDTLKIDKSLVDYIGKKAGDGIIHHTIALAKELGLHVTAEGVETEEQARFLNEESCDSIQGFYFARPMEANHFGELLCG